MTDEEKLHHLIDAFIELQDDVKQLREALPKMFEEQSKSLRKEFSDKRTETTINHSTS